MSIHQLILHPRDLAAAPERAAQVQCLSALDFVGEAMDEPGFHRPGEEFLYLLTFLGCSPVVSLGEPGPTADFCRIEVAASEETPRFVAGANVKPPRCPACGHRFDDWQERVAIWNSTGSADTVCPACSTAHALPTLRWRQSAGFGRCMVRVWGIFEGEAVPGEKLMAALETLTGGPWTYFYFRED
jgi:hypothetical protein